jgi:hypothetical protein
MAVALVSVTLASNAATELSRARELAGSLDYDQVIPIAQSLAARGDLTSDEQLEAYLLLGSALAIIGSNVDAERPFRLLLRARPEFDLPAATSPRIMAVFRKVQVEERAIGEQMRRLERERLRESLGLTGEHPTAGRGGYPLHFAYHLTDPRGAVRALSLHFRRQGDPAFSALALHGEPTGAWSGEIPGEITENAAGLRLEFYVVMLDGAGDVLKSAGGPDAPLVVELESGTVDEARPLYRSPWFWTLGAGALLAIGATAAIAYDQASELPASDLGVYRMP